MPTIVIYTDGGARGNPGPAGAGVVIIDGDTNHEFKKYLGKRQTNNWAEYEAVAIALTEAKQLGLTDRPLEVRMDSQLVVEQLTGNWKIKEPNLQTQASKVRHLLAEFPSYRFKYVPRAQNKEADRLVNQAIDEAGE
ncbi:MAG: ribonuclease HI family protein [Candidatus Pacebacteria bacterium]|nr:ribonuclease HI family protein [Candidatus Paceibacterota bacterium]